MNSRKQHLLNIIKANSEKRLVIFIGAGISKSAENSSIKIPTWKDLISDLRNELGIEAEEDYLKIAQLYYIEFKEHAYYDKISRYFPKNISPSIIHHQIFKLRPKYIITTNWDSILEKAIETNAYIYDVVASDKDLIKSTLQNKVIKMHGDFKSHNIVFREDDYLNYQRNFPLIENYIKSIISTHTVLFLGYSYNDINLKHIIKWLQSYSSSQPPMYLTVFKKNPTQDKYLEAHGITTIVLDDAINNYENLDSYSNKMAGFLDIILNPLRLHDEYSNDDIINFMYRKLKVLDGLDCILTDQIRDTITNCGFLYTDCHLTILQFYFNYATYDLDENTRTLHKSFVKLLVQYDKGEYKNDVINKIFCILRKANIDGVDISTNNNSSEIEYIALDKNQPINSFVNTCLNFNISSNLEKYNSESDHFKTELAFLNYQLGNYKHAYKITNEIISSSMRQRNYPQLFIAMFNSNTLLGRLKYSLSRQTSEIFNDIKEYNLKEMLNDLPKDLQDTLELVYKFINFEYIYRYAFLVSQQLKKKEESKNTITKGGMVFNTNITKLSSQHRNFILFIIKNKIMIDESHELKTIMRCLVEIALIRQIQKKEISLDKLELYSCIKHFEQKHLEKSLEMCLPNPQSLTKPFVISSENKDWLINTVFPNICELFVESEELSNPHQENLENLIFLISLINLNSNEIKASMDCFMKVIKSSGNTIKNYETINNFLRNQHQLFKTKISVEQLVQLIEAVIIKFAYRQNSHFDYHAITNHCINNIYSYAKISNAKFSNIKLISKLLLELNDFDLNEKIRITQSLLFSIYEISTPSIKKQIKQFSLKIPLQLKSNIESPEPDHQLKNISTSYETAIILIFQLHLVIKDFIKLDESLTLNLEKYISQFSDGRFFSSVLHTIRSQLRYLVDIKKQESLTSNLKKIESIIDNHKKIENPSIF